MSGISIYNAGVTCGGKSYQYVCFSDSYTLGESEVLAGCDIQFVIGWKVVGVSSDTIVKVSWTLNVERPA
jgi:hypothetical protein